MPKPSNAPRELPKLLSVQEVAKAFSCSPGTVLRLCKSGQLPSLKIGGRRKVAHHDAWVYLQQLRRQSSQGTPSQRAALAKDAQTPPSAPEAIQALQEQLEAVGQMRLSADNVLGASSDT